MDPSHCCLKAEANQALAEIRELAKPFMALRHKRLAHRDHPVALGEVVLEGFSREQVESILKGVRDLMNLIQLKLKGSETVWEQTYLPDDGNSLIWHLRKGAAYSELVKEGKIQRIPRSELPYRDV